MKNEIISFKNIHKSYYLGEHEIKALKNLNFSVKKESFIFEEQECEPTSC